MDTQPLPSRTPVRYANSSDFADNTIRILARLGYDILSPERFEMLRTGPNGDPSRRPDVFIVDEARLCEFPASDGQSEIPIVKVVSGASAPAESERVAASVMAPVGLHDLYRVLQQVLEDCPRTTPRIRTQLAGVCSHAGREWPATVVSLSENGCLLHTSELIPLGTQLQLDFEVPGSGRVHITAEAAYHLLSDIGLVFSSIAPRIRELIARYVTDSLLEANPASLAPTR